MINSAAAPDLCQSWESRRLWSLWDMLNFNAKAFYDVTTSVQHTRTLIEAKKDTYVQEHADGSVTLTLIYDRPFIDMMIKRAEALQASLVILDTKVALLTVAKHIKSLQQIYPYSYQDLASAYRDLNTTLTSELGLTFLLALDWRERDLFEPKQPVFGKEVDDKFPSALYEIDEAAKCLALERSTAGAFHSIRCLEAAIRGISRCLGIPDPTKAAGRNWGAMLGSIKNETDRRWPTSSDRLSGDGQFFDDAYAALAAMQNPWRNATMHLDQKYTPQEAKHIFDVVGGFMRKISSRMDEDGLPLA